MIAKVALLLTLSVFVVSYADTTPPQNWAVLVAGSNYWYNYRHQADVCHAYQVVHNHGIPDSNIIVMMYDDIANFPLNPTPGIVINHPNGDDVYHGVPKDYTGADVTPENFMAVLTGNETAVKGKGSGRVLKSGPNDRVFLNFVDHGGVGILAFPDEFLSVQQLETTLRTMYKQNQYAKLVFYVEACEAGSMFQNSLPDDINMYVTTASSWNESSYACYYDELRQTYLGDLYSVNWMENSDASDLSSETLTTQFQDVKSLTNLSHVQQYGDVSIASLVVGAFQGQASTAKKVVPKVPRTTTPSYDVPLDILIKRLSAAKDEEKRNTIKREMERMLVNRHVFEDNLKQVLNVIGSKAQAAAWMDKRPTSLKNIKCHDQLTHAFSKNCYNFGQNPYATRFAYVFVNICESGIDANIATAALTTACQSLIKSNVMRVH